MTKGIGSIANKNNKKLFFIFAAIFFLFWYLAAQVEKVDDFDLHRYYEGAEFMRDWPLLEVILVSSGRAVDFIYYVILHWACRCSIPLNIITALVCTITFYLIVYSINRIANTKIDWYVYATVLLLSPLLWRVSIARNMMAIMFLYAGILFFYKNKRIWGTLLTIAGILTHFSVLMYVAIFIACYFVRKMYISRGFVLVILFMALVVSYFMPTSLLSFFESVISGGEDIMTNQYTVHSWGLLSWTNLGYGDLLAIVFSFSFSVFLLLLNERRNFGFWTLFALTLLFGYFLNSSQMFTIRVLLILPLFWGLNVADIFARGKKTVKDLVGIVSLVGLMPVLVYVYALRPVFFGGF